MVALGSDGWPCALLAPRAAATIAAASTAAAAARCPGGRGLDAFELVRVGGARAERLDDLGLAHAAVAQHNDHVSPRAGRGLI